MNAKESVAPRVENLRLKRRIRIGTWRTYENASETYETQKGDTKVPAKALFEKPASRG